MTLFDRLNKIIDKRNISKVEFARRIGVTKKYIYILTGNSRKDTDQNKVISPMLAKIITMGFGYAENWILNGDE